MIEKKEPVHFDEKKNLTKIWQDAKILVTCQNFGRISYIVTKIWQQTKAEFERGEIEKIGEIRKMR